MATTSSFTLNTHDRQTYSCMRCAERKVKCDRKHPCNACTRHNAECVFNPLQPPRNRRKHLNVQALTDRLKRYEALLKENGIDPSRAGDALGTSEGQKPRQISHTTAVSTSDLQPNITPSDDSEPGQASNDPQRNHNPGRFKLTDNVLWNRTVEEFYDPHDDLGDYSDDLSDQEIVEDDLGFILVHQKSNIKSCHPSLENIHQLWQIFTENVDPLTKIVHVPTLGSAIDKAARNINTIPRNFEALMFALYSAAVMSLTDDECKQRFNEPRRVLLPQYISATKAALLRAKFMGSTSLVVLQALVIHLLVVRDVYEPRAVWSLTGVAVRIAQSIGVDRDGTLMGLSPFETEMRRRIWWQLKMHDFRTAELCGVSKFQDLDTGTGAAKWPSNVNDTQLYPEMQSITAKRDTITDFVFVSLKCEFLRYTASRIANFQQDKTTAVYIPGSDPTAMDTSFQQLEELLETKYLRYCDPSQPLHLMAMLMARCSMNVIRFISHHPRRWASLDAAPPAERQWVWDLCIKLLEQHSMLQSNPQLKQFAWHGPYFQQWHAIIHVLDVLRANPLTSGADKAWKLIGNIYEVNSEMSHDMRKPIHVAVGNLCLNAYSNREAILSNRNTRQQPTPHFVEQLRRQRETAKAAREEQRAKRRYPEGSANDRKPNTLNNDQSSRQDSSYQGLSEVLGSASLEQSKNSLPTGLSQTEELPIATERDPFWFDGQADEIDDVNMDLDKLLDPETVSGDNAPQTITWDQWDSWLADSNVLSPLSS